MLKLNINKKLASDHFDSIKDSIINRINVITAKGSFRYSREPIVLTHGEIATISQFTNPDVLKELVTVSPERLNALVRTYRIKYANYQDSTSRIYKLFERVFYNYGYKEIENEKFISNIGIDTCPYCNRNYIYALDKAGKIKPELDHFYPSSIYPILSACYYNLIPSCQTCNGFGGKHDTDTYQAKLTSPYLFKPDDFKFGFKLNSLARINPISGKSSVDVYLEKGLTPHIDIFKLDHLYKKHSDHVLELIVKSRLRYSPKYRTYLSHYKGLKFSQIEIDRLILGNYSKESELHKRPLSILYKDVAKKLGLIS